MKVLLYRRSLDLRSGAGQLMRMQALGLKAAGVQVCLACERGALKFFLRTGLWVRRSSAVELQNRRIVDHLIVDHGMQIPSADLVFVHNLLTEANRHQQRADWSDRAVAETAFFRELNAGTPLVANSELVKAALIGHFGLDAQRIIVHYPGFQSDKFVAARAPQLRRRARQALRVDAATPLLGFVTSGDFQKRGLDLFLAGAERIAAAVPEARFLVVGSTTLPDWAQGHPLMASGRLLYRPKNNTPELWIAALDLFLYAARFEEFGMVILEAQALGVPVVTSRRVGAAECLPAIYDRWLIDAPDPERLAANALALLADEESRRDLASAGVANAAARDDRSYVRATLATILAQNR